MTETGIGWQGVSDKTCRKAAVVLVFRPLGGEFRTLDLALPEEKAKALFAFLSNPGEFEVREVRLWTDQDGWTTTKRHYPAPRTEAET